MPSVFRNWNTRRSTASASHAAWPTALVESPSRGPVDKILQLLLQTPGRGVQVHRRNRGLHLRRLRPRMLAKSSPSDKTTGIRGDAETALQCSFCRKRAREVRTFVQSSADNICNECVELCVEIIENGTKTSRPEELDDMIERGRQAVSRGADKRDAMELGAAAAVPHDVVGQSAGSAGVLRRSIRSSRQGDPPRIEVKRSRRARSPFTTWAHPLRRHHPVPEVRRAVVIRPDPAGLRPARKRRTRRFAEVPGAKIQTAGLRGLLH